MSPSISYIYFATAQLRIVQTNWHVEYDTDYG